MIVWRGARHGVLAALLALCAAPCASSAQDTTKVAPPVRADTDTVPPRTLPVNGLLLRPRHLRYRMSVISPDSTHLVGYRDVDVQLTTYGGFPAWLLAETRDGAVPSVDTLYASYLDLRPLHWSSTIGQARLALEFTADSVYGGTSGPSGNQTVVRAHGSDLLASAAMTDAAIELMPHRVGRVDSVNVFVVDLGSNRILPGVVSVDGEQDVATATGPTHCWLITLSTAEGSVHYWVSQTDPVVVQTRQSMPGEAGLTFEQTLVSRP